MAMPPELRPRYEAARAAWPGVELAQEDFAQWLRERPGVRLEQERVNELYLACACARGDRRALEAFERAFFREVDAAVQRMGPPAFVDDVKQHLRQRLFVGDGAAGPKVAEFSGRGALARWLRAVAARVALNLLRDRGGPPVQPLEEDELLGPQVSSEDPALAHMKRLYGAAFSQAFKDALASLPPEGQNYLRLYYLDGLDLADLAGLYRVSVPTASRRLARARAQALEATRALLQDRLRVSAPELDSIMRLIQSRLSVAGGGGPPDGHLK